MSFTEPKESTSSQNVETPDSSGAAEQSGWSSHPCQIDPEVLRLGVPVIAERANVSRKHFEEDMNPSCPRRSNRNRLRPGHSAPRIYV
jgi:hypothetical protein